MMFFRNLIYFTFFQLFLNWTAWAEFSPLSPEFEKIMEIRLSDRTVLTSGALLYEVNGVWYIPLIEFSDYLGIKISAKAQETGALGFIIDESKKFDLDYARHRVEVGQANETFTGDQVIAANSDFYVESRHLSTWLPVELTIDPFKSLVIVNPTEELPIQARARREEDLILPRASGTSANSRLEVIQPKETLFDGPFIDTQVDTTRKLEGGSAGEKKQSVSIQAGASSQVLTFDSSTHLATDDGKLGAFTQTFSRKDPKGNLLGVMHLQEIVLLDLQTPSLPLIVRGRSWRGVLISSYPFSFNTYSSQNIEGEILPGWQVELYQNEILMGRQNATPEGRYSFKDLTLYYGRNTFKLVFYGPYGQKREQYQSYDIDSSILKSGAFYYRASAFESTTQGALGFFQIDQSLSSNLSFGASFSRNELKVDRSAHPYGGLTLNGFFTGINVNAAAAFADDQGTAYEIATRIPISTATAGAKYTLLKNFRSDLYNNTPEPSTRMQKSQLDADTQFRTPLFPSIQSSFEWQEKRFESDPLPERSLKNRLAFQKNSWGLNHEVTYRFASPTPFECVGEVSTIVGSTRMRAALNYDLKTLRSVEEELEFQLDDRYSASLGSRQDLIEKQTEGRTTLSRAFEPFALGATLFASTAGEVSAGLTLRTSLSRDPVSKAVRLDSRSFADQGAVSVLVFQDVNLNGIFDGNDKPMPGLFLSVDQRKSERATEEDGRLFIPHLSPYQSIGIEIALESLTDPHLRTSKQGVRVTPRPGTTQEVQLPLVAIGTVAGIVDHSLSKGNTPQKFVPIELLDQNKNVIRSSRTSAQGIYWIEDLQPGHYWIRVKSDWLTSYHLLSEPSSQAFEISSQGEDVQINFILSQSKSR